MRRFVVKDFGADEYENCLRHIKVFAITSIVYRAVCVLSEPDFCLTKSVVTNLTEVDLWFDPRNEDPASSVEFAFKLESDIEWEEWLKSLDKKGVVGPETK